MKHDTPIFVWCVILFVLLRHPFIRVWKLSIYEVYTYHSDSMCGKWVNKNERKKYAWEMYMMCVESTPSEKVFRVAADETCARDVYVVCVTPQSKDHYSFRRLPCSLSPLPMAWCMPRHFLNLLCLCVLCSSSEWNVSWLRAFSICCSHSASAYQQTSHHTERCI